MLFANYCKRCLKRCIRKLIQWLRSVINKNYACIGASASAWHGAWRGASPSAWHGAWIWRSNWICVSTEASNVGRSHLSYSFYVFVFSVNLPRPLVSGLDISDWKENRTKNARNVRLSSCVLPPVVLLEVPLLLCPDHFPDVWIFSLVFCTFSFSHFIHRSLGSCTILIGSLAVNFVHS